MDIIDTLKFVQGAVATKDLIPEMTHFVIEDGEVRAFNGIIAISSPIDFNVDCMPKAGPLVRAITNCEEVASLGMTPGGRLRIQSGKFKAFIDCIEGEVPHQKPEGDRVEIDGEKLLKAIKVLSPFIGNDASRPWTNGILLRGESAFATNNVCLVEYWLGTTLPHAVNIPAKAIKEMDRVGVPPSHAQLTEHSITFHYSDGRWIRTQLYSTEWPDLTKLLNAPSNPKPVNEDLFEGLRIVRPFADKSDRVWFEPGGITTSPDDGLGARYAVEGLHDQGIYKIGMLKLLEGVAEQIDFTLYQGPLLFYGEGVRGAIIGLRT